MPTVCTDHLGRWGGDPLCKACRTVTGQARRRERAPRTRLRWNTEGVGLIVIVSVGVGLWAGLNLAPLLGHS